MLSTPRESSQVPHQALPRNVIDLDSGSPFFEDCMEVSSEVTLEVKQSLPVTPTRNRVTMPRAQSLAQSSATTGEVRMEDRLTQIIQEYDDMIHGLASLTADLPKRLLPFTARPDSEQLPRTAVLNPKPTLTFADLQCESPRVQVAGHARSRATSDQSDASRNRGLSDHSVVQVHEASTASESSKGHSPKRTRGAGLCFHLEKTDKSSASDVNLRMTSSDLGFDHVEFLQQSPTAEAAHESQGSMSTIVCSDQNDLYTRDFSMRVVWNVDQKRMLDAIQAAHGSSVREHTHDLMISRQVFEYDLKVENSSAQKGTCGGSWRFEPDGPKRLGWEFFGIALVIYDLLSIPLWIAFDPPASVFQDVMNWAQRCYWTLNIPIVLLTGFIDEKGVVNMDLRYIACRYARTWLWVDLFTVVPDWTATIYEYESGKDVDTTGNQREAFRLIRSLRFLRLIRLLRLVKLRNAWNMIYDMIDSERAGLFFDMFQMLLLLAIYNHYNACLWFQVGRSSSGSNWMKHHGFTNDKVDWGHQYLVAYHWSLTQLTPASMHVQPQFVVERMFAIFVIFVGLVGFSYLVGSITSSLSRLRAMKERKTANFWQLRKFLKKNRIPHALSVRIRMYVEGRWDAQNINVRLHEQAFVKYLSDQLRSELEFSLHAPALCIHPLFQQLAIDSKVTIQRLSHHGVSVLALAPQDVMFHAGESSTHLSLLTTGSMHYERLYFDKTYVETVDSHEDWISEATLWVNDWRHLGDLRAAAPADLLQVCPNALQRITFLNPLATWMVVHYARSYTEWLCKCDRNLLSDITQGENLTEDLRKFVKKFHGDIARKTVKVDVLTTLPFSLKKLASRTWSDIRS